MSVLAIVQYTTDAKIASHANTAWYTCVTIATVCCGDRFPVAATDRLFGVMTIAEAKLAEFVNQKGSRRLPRATAHNPARFQEARWG